MSFNTVWLQPDPNSPEQADSPVCRSSLRTLAPVLGLALLVLVLFLVLGSNQASGDEYYDYDSMVNELKTWAQEPSSEDIVTVSDLSEIYPVPNTEEGRSLWMVTISDQDSLDRDGEQEPKLLFIGGLEGRNWLSVEACMALAETLVKDYQVDPRIQRLVDNNEIYLIPMVNPDGSQYSRDNDDPLDQGEAGWIKNLNDEKGVNINRNFDVLWNRDLESGTILRQ